MILVAEIAATVWAYIYSDALEPVVRSYVKSTVQEEYWHDSDRQYTFDTIQKEVGIKHFMIVSRLISFTKTIINSSQISS